MNRWNASSVALAALVLGTAPAAFAASDAMQDEATADQHVGSAQIQSFDHAKMSLRDVIGKAESEAHGHALSAEFAQQTGTPAYTVRVLQDKGEVWQAKIDANSGKVIGSPTTTAQAKLDREDKSEIAELQTAKKKLPDAVSAVEQKSGGKAINAEIEHVGGKAVYQIQLIKQGKVEKMQVDPTNGNVLASGTPETHNGASGMSTTHPATGASDR